MLNHGKVSVFPTLSGVSRKDDIVDKTKIAAEKRAIDIGAGFKVYTDDSESGYKRVCRKTLQWKCSRTSILYMPLRLESLKAYNPSDSSLKDSEKKSWYNGFQDITTS